MVGKEKKVTKRLLKKLAKRDGKKKLKEWSIKVKERDGKQCVVCSETKMLNAHHIIVKEIKELKFDVMNGISLCPRHHQFSREMSAHSNSFAFFVWFKENRPEQYEYLRKKLLELQI